MQKIDSLGLWVLSDGDVGSQRREPSAVWWAIGERVDLEWQRIRRTEGVQDRDVRGDATVRDRVVRPTPGADHGLSPGDLHDQRRLGHGETVLPGSSRTWAVVPDQR